MKMTFHFQRPMISTLRVGDCIELVKRATFTRADNVAIPVLPRSVFRITRVESNGRVYAATQKVFDSNGNEIPRNLLGTLVLGQGAFDIHEKAQELDIDNDESAKRVPFEETIGGKQRAMQMFLRNALGEPSKKQSQFSSDIPGSGNAFREGSDPYVNSDSIQPNNLTFDMPEEIEVAELLIDSGKPPEEVIEFLMEHYDLTQETAEFVIEKLRYASINKAASSNLPEGLEYLGVDDWFHYFVDPEGRVYCYVSEVSPWWDDLAEKYYGVSFTQLSPDQQEELTRKARSNGDESREVLKEVGTFGKKVLTRDEDADQALEDLKDLPKYGMPSLYANKIFSLQVGDKVKPDDLWPYNLELEGVSKNAVGEVVKKEGDKVLVWFPEEDNRGLLLTFKEEQLVTASRKTAYFQVGDRIRDPNDVDAKPMKIEDVKIDFGADAGRSSGRVVYKVTGLGWISEIDIEKYQKVGRDPKLTPNIHKDKQDRDNPSQHGFEGEAQPKDLEKLPRKSASQKGDRIKLTANEESEQDLALGSLAYQDFIPPKEFDLTAAANAPTPRILIPGSKDAILSTLKNLNIKPKDVQDLSHKEGILLSVTTPSDVSSILRIFPYARIKN